MEVHDVIDQKHVIVFPFTKVDEPKIKLPEWMTENRFPSSLFYSLRKQPPYLFIKGLEDDKKYCFLQTIANPETVKAVNKSSLSKMYDDRDDIDFYFDGYLMNFYLTSLSEGLKDQGLWHFAYPRVENRGGLNVGSGVLVSWPIVHIVEDGVAVDKFKELVSKMNGDGSGRVSLRLGRTEKWDKMFNEKRDLIGRTGLSPLEIVGPEIRISGETARTQGQPFQLYVFNADYRQECYSDD